MDSAPEPSKTTCERMRALIVSFATRGGSLSANREFRTHISTCEECRAEYKGSLASAARLGRALRSTRSE